MCTWLDWVAQNDFLLNKIWSECFFLSLLLLLFLFLTIPNTPTEIKLTKRTPLLPENEIRNDCLYGTNKLWVKKKRIKTEPYSRWNKKYIFIFNPARSRYYCDNKTLLLHSFFSSFLCFLFNFFPFHFLWFFLLAALLPGWLIFLARTLSCLLSYHQAYCCQKFSRAQVFFLHALLLP